MKHLILIACCAALTSCSLSEEDIRKHAWKYDSGYYIGDFPDFNLFHYRLTDDTIFVGDTARAVVYDSDKYYLFYANRLHIRSISGGKTGTYIEFGPSTPDSVEIILTPPPPVDPPPPPPSPPGK